MHKDKQHDIPPHKKQTWFESFVTVFYRVVFASSFGLQRYISKYLGLLCLVLGTLSMKFLGIYLEKTPVLYLYRSEKRVMFHDDGAVKYLEREAKENRSKSNAIVVEGAGHWLYLQEPDFCLKNVMEFMSK